VFFRGAQMTVLAEPWPKETKYVLTTKKLSICCIQGDQTYLNVNVCVHNSINIITFLGYIINILINHVFWLQMLIVYFYNSFCSPLDK